MTSKFGFKRRLVLTSQYYSKGKVEVSGVHDMSDGTRTLIVTSSDPRQYIEVPFYLIDRVVDDLNGLELQDAMARRTKANGN